MTKPAKKPPVKSPTDRIPATTKLLASDFSFVTNNVILYQGKYVGQIVSAITHFSPDNDHVPHQPEFPPGLILTSDCPLHWKHIALAIKEQRDEWNVLWTEEQDSFYYNINYRIG